MQSVEQPPASAHDDHKDAPSLLAQKGGDRAGAPGKDEHDGEASYAAQSSAPVQVYHGMVSRAHRDKEEKQILTSSDMKAASGSATIGVSVPASWKPSPFTLVHKRRFSTQASPLLQQSA